VVFFVLLIVSVMMCRFRYYFMTFPHKKLTGSLKKALLELGTACLFSLGVPDTHGRQGRNKGYISSCLSWSYLCKYKPAVDIFACPAVA
jgi:hypothetical protein